METTKALASSSVTVSVRLAGPLTPSAFVADPETVKVLSGASTELSTAVIVTVPVLVVSPAAIVSVVLLDRPTSSAEAPWPGVTDTATVVGCAEP